MADIRVIEQSDDLTHVALTGRLDALGAQALDLKLTSHTAARKKPAIVDLAGVEFVASLGIGILVGAARGLRGHGCGMVLLAPQDRVLKVLQGARVDEILPIAKTREQALELLRTLP